MAIQKHQMRIPDDAREHAAEELIAKYIEPHPAKPGFVNYSLKENEGGYPVWAIIGDLAPGILSEADIMREIRISREALDAALAFYARHEDVIDARIIANRLD
jgi:hypothetical protein